MENVTVKKKEYVLSITFIEIPNHQTTLNGMTQTDTNKENLLCYLFILLTHNGQPMREESNTISDI